jgi:hypothetical protein
LSLNGGSLFGYDAEISEGCCGSRKEESPRGKLSIFCIPYLVMLILDWFWEVFLLYAFLELVWRMSFSTSLICFRSCNSLCQAKLARKKALDDMSKEVKEGFESMKFYKFYPVKSEHAPDITEVKVSIVIISSVYDFSPPRCIILFQDVLCCLVHLCLCSYSEALDNLTVIVNECLVC